VTHTHWFGVLAFVIGLGMLLVIYVELNSGQASHRTVLNRDKVDHLNTRPKRFWMLVVLHLLGSICLLGSGASLLVGFPEP
jgi:hypothetical protein